MGKGKVFGDEYVRGQMRTKVLMICGYCQRGRFLLETRGKVEYYERLGCA